MDAHERRQPKRQLAAWVVLLVCLPYILLIGGGVSMCVLYKPGEPIGTVGYTILAIMLTPLLASYALTILLSWRRWYLDLDCLGCGHPFSSRDLPILESGRCPECGRSFNVEELRDCD